MVKMGKRERKKLNKELQKSLKTLRKMLDDKHIKGMKDMFEKLAYVAPDRVDELIERYEQQVEKLKELEDALENKIKKLNEKK